MIEIFDIAAAQLGLRTSTVVLATIGLGVLFAFYGITTSLTYVDPATARLTRTREDRAKARQDRGLLKDRIETSKGVLKSFVPQKEGELNALRIKLIQAGYRGSMAVQTYTLIRIGLGFGLPLAFILLIGIASMPGVYLPAGLSDRIGGLSHMGMFQILSILTFVGFFLPTKHIESRAKETRQRITEAFPNALDLMQISVEAGLGFDAAMTRVANELATTCPELSVEFLSAQQQIQAGRPRDEAMREMAERTGVDTVKSFASVVYQSLKFGTPMTEALQTYAREMRVYREMAAQEMANKLPVKMSVVLASFMLPALVLMTVGPTVIRWISYSGAN